MFLKNKNIIFKLRRSKVTDYAALKPIHKHMRPEYGACHVFLAESNVGYMSILILHSHYMQLVNILITSPLQKKEGRICGTTFIFAIVILTIC